ncbi:MAG: glycogen/starch synthase [Flavobacteriaceae bacterium]|nr:glycogen/starch synthase [Flavobacteriaceae bacterium]
MQVVHLSAECFPVAKVGGLGDVVGALPKYLNKTEGMNAMVVMPFVENKFTKTHLLTVDFEMRLPFGNRNLQVKILKNTDLGFNLYLVQIEGFAYRENVYGYRNDPYFFTAFQVATLNWIHQWTHLPDVIHCHDFHTGFVPFMMKHAHQFPRFRNIPSVFTIHNANYQGQMPWDVVDYFPWFNTWDLPLLEWDNTLNAMASAIKCAWRVTTVSPQYMRELMEGNLGLAPLFQQEWQKCSGILNGIDTEEWNPETDKRLDHNYNIENVKEGKRRNKNQICEAFKLNPEYPLISFIGRFVDQKGADVLSDAIWQAIREFDAKMSFLIIGSGDPQLSNGLEQMKIFTDGRFNCFIGYNENLARKVYAASDFLVMPSRFEPCGLNQFYALRYGTIPIVRTVGGLLDSVQDINDENGNGIRFIHLNTHDLLHAFHRAGQVFDEKEKLQILREFIMNQDFSWEKSAKKYIELYEKL